MRSAAQGGAVEITLAVKNQGRFRARSVGAGVAEVVQHRLLRNGRACPDSKNCSDGDEERGSAQQSPEHSREASQPLSTPPANRLHKSHFLRMRGPDTLV